MNGTPGYLLFAPFVGIVVDILAHISLSRIDKRGAHVTMQFISIGVGFFITLLTLIFFLNGDDVSLANKIAYGILYIGIYLEFAFILFNVINANVSSLRVRMLKEYFSMGEQGLSDHSLIKKYSASEILEARIQRLTAGEQIYLRENRFYPAKGGVAIIALFFNGLRYILLKR
jgi:hypothetical protein